MSNPWTEMKPDHRLISLSGKLYSQILVFFWRTVRHKGIWLKPKHLMRLFTSPKLHAHTADACVQAFFARAAFQVWQVWLLLSSGWRWGYEHPSKVSWGLRLPRSWRYGTAHQHT